MQIQIVSDVVCPWCRIGKHNLQAAAEQFTKQTGETVEISFLPFLLDPISPEEEGENYRDRFLNRKGISGEQMKEMHDRVTEVGKQFGVTFNFDAIKTAVNTVPAHELVELAPVEKRWDLMDALMSAHFERGENIGDVEVLLGIATRVLGTEITSDIAPALKGRAMEPTVRDMIAQMHQAGVTGVPFTIIDGKLAVNGGQPPQAFYGAMMQVWEENQVGHNPDGGSAIPTN